MVSIEWFMAISSKSLQLQFIMIKRSYCVDSFDLRLQTYDTHDNRLPNSGDDIN